MRKRTPKAEFKTSRKEQYLPISWIENSKGTPKYLQTWSNKKERKRLENGLFLSKKSNPWLRPRCSRSFVQERERENAGREGSIKCALSERTSLESLQNTKGLSVQWVLGSKKQTWPIPNWRQLSSCLSYPWRRTLNQTLTLLWEWSPKVSLY